MMPLLAATAQISHSPQGNTDEKAEVVLKHAAAQFDNNVVFSLKATMVDAEKKTVAEHSAQVFYNKGRYRLTMPELEVISNGKTVWQWNRQASEVIVSDVGTDDIDPLNPGQLLAGYSQAFRAKYIRTENDGTAIIDLQPRSARQFHKIRLMIDEKSGHLRRMEVHRYDGSRELYTIIGFKKTNTPDRVFTFDPTQHRGVEVIDMR